MSFKQRFCRSKNKKEEKMTNCNNSESMPKETVTKSDSVLDQLKRLRLDETKRSPLDELKRSFDNGRNQPRVFGAQFTSCPPSSNVPCDFYGQPPAYPCPCFANAPPPPPPVPNHAMSNEDLWDLQFSRWWGWNWVRKRDEFLNKQKVCKKQPVVEGRCPRNDDWGCPGRGVGNWPKHDERKQPRRDEGKGAKRCVCDVAKPKRNANKGFRNFCMMCKNYAKKKTRKSIDPDKKREMQKYYDTPCSSCVFYSDTNNYEDRSMIFEGNIEYSRNGACKRSLSTVYVQKQCRRPRHKTYGICKNDYTSSSDEYYCHSSANDNMEYVNFCMQSMQSDSEDYCCQCSRRQQCCCHRPYKVICCSGNQHVKKDRKHGKCKNTETQTVQPRSKKVVEKSTATHRDVFNPVKTVCCPCRNKNKYATICVCKPHDMICCHCARNKRTTRRSNSDTDLNQRCRLNRQKNRKKITMVKSMSTQCLVNKKDKETCYDFKGNPFMEDVKTANFLTKPIRSKIEEGLFNSIPSVERCSTILDNNSYFVSPMSGRAYNLATNDVAETPTPTPFDRKRDGVLEMISEECSLQTLLQDPLKIEDREHNELLIDICEAILSARKATSTKNELKTPSVQTVNLKQEYSMEDLLGSRLPNKTKSNIAEAFRHLGSMSTKQLYANVEPGPSVRPSLVSVADPVFASSYPTPPAYFDMNPDPYRYPYTDPLKDSFSEPYRDSFTDPYKPLNTPQNMTMGEPADTIPNADITTRQRPSILVTSDDARKTLSGNNRKSVQIEDNYSVYTLHKTTMELGHKYRLRLHTPPPPPPPIHITIPSHGKTIETQTSDSFYLATLLGNKDVDHKVDAATNFETLCAADSEKILSCIDFGKQTIAQNDAATNFDLLLPKYSDKILSAIDLNAITEDISTAMTQSELFPSTSESVEINPFIIDEHSALDRPPTLNLDYETLLPRAKQPLQDRARSYERATSHERAPSVKREAKKKMEKRVSPFSTFCRPVQNKNESKPEPIAKTSSLSRPRRRLLLDKKSLKSRERGWRF